MHSVVGLICKYEIGIENLEYMFIQAIYSGSDAAAVFMVPYLSLAPENICLGKLRLF